MPFSDRSKQGFENKIADIVADQLKEPVRYLWAPSGPGFARNTLNADLCDIVIGYAVGSDVMQSTNPYYRSTYVIVAPKGSALADVSRDWMTPSSRAARSAFSRPRHRSTSC